MSQAQQASRRTRPGDVWWHVYPLGALGAPIREAHDGVVVHRLRGLLPWLDHVVDLGFTGLQLGPVLASSTHGYDTVDLYSVDPRLGDRADLDALLAAAHERGLRVMLDGVFDHVGADHPLHRRALAEGPGSDAARLFRIDWSGQQPVSACFEGHGDLVLLNHEAPEVVDLVADAMLHWSDAGVDAWRLDAAYAVDPAFWAQVLPRVRAAHPGVTVVGEVIHGDYADVVARSGMDGVTQYELWKATWSSIVDRNLFELAHALGRHDAFVAAFRPMTFVGNHDTSRIASVVGDGGAALAATVLMTVGGEPSVYYGDEHAFRGVKEQRLGGDDDVRPALPRTPADLAPHGRWLEDLHRRLVDLRRRHPWLVDARTEVLELSNERIVYRSTPRPAVAGGAVGSGASGRAVGASGGAGGASGGAITVELDLVAMRADVRADGDREAERLRVG